ncbi:MAG: hypothetical protein IJ791_03500 [Lachnospiraceae bacterium]|jgi:hypothetical protein|nr:hypothetical protein [Lachnospiraceae bacterium]
MKKIDMRINQSLVQDWIGKKFTKYCCDPFDFTNSVTQIVGLYIDEDIYALTNIQEEVDYFGNKEDIAVLKLAKTENENIKSAFDDVEMIPSPVEGMIASVKVVNELQKMSIDGEAAYEVWLTRAIVFEVDGREISFEKDVVPFSEEIVIQKGYNLIEKISDNDGFLDDWDEKYEPEYIRETIDIK